MAKIMTNTELILRMKELVNEPNKYGCGGTNWSNFSPTVTTNKNYPHANYKNKWYVDCVCIIKTILWGGRFIPSNRNKAHAGCKYGSNGVPDKNANGFIDWCTNLSKDFTKLTIGECVGMPGHVGIYIGNGEVIETTAAWEGKCLISKIGTKGQRVRNGKQVGSWTKHGKIPVVDYTNTNSSNNSTTTTNKVSYYPKSTYKGTSIVDALEKIEVDSSFENRQEIAKMNGMNLTKKNSAKVNTDMLTLIKSGKLIKP